MIETPRLTIIARRPEDDAKEEDHLILFPEILQLDPPVGKSEHPVFFSVLEKEGNAYIGACCFYNYTRSRVELGVRISAPSYWGKGYGSEIVNALCEFVFNNFPVVVVLAKTPVYNTRAIACYEKCGFTKYSQDIMDGYEMVFLARNKSQ